jgi:hypothetical protein
MEVKLDSRYYYGLDERFTLSLDASDLAKGLRPSKRNPRNTPYAIVCDGAVGRDGVLSRLEELTRVDTSIITDGFPYPQLFVGSYFSIVFGKQDVYEYDGAFLVLKITAPSAGSLWDCFIEGDYAFMSNGVVSIERNPESKEYSVAADKPIVQSICNFDGQVLAGTPTLAFTISEIDNIPDSMRR